MSSIVVVSNDAVGSRMAGPGIRYWQFAHWLSRSHSVTLVTPNAGDLTSSDFRIEHADVTDAAAVIELCDSADGVVSQRLPVQAMLELARRKVTTIYDLYAPVLVETLALHHVRRPTRHLRTVLRSNSLIEEVILRTGAAFICASERQRDYWLGELAALGRLTHEAYAADPSLRSLIDLVPFGIDAEPAVVRGAIKGAVDGIAQDDRVLIWPGGIWNWFDPLTVIRAVGRLEPTHPNLRLFFLGMQHPNPAIEPMEMAARAVTLSRELGLLGHSVFFNEEWVPYAERSRYLLDADVGVSAHLDTFEARLAFRTRLLDCFWTGLPIVATEGDELADAAAAHNAGKTVPPGDDAAFADALAEVLDGGAPDMHRASQGLADRYRWPVVIERLPRLLETAEPPPARSPRFSLRMRDAATRARWSFEVRGVSAVGHAVRRVGARGSRPLR